MIVPAYNSEKTLEKCLNSLYDKSLQDEIEVLIINDGSADSTESIAKTFENKHPSYRLISKQNGGHGSTINTASKVATGRYMKVIDSDDWVVNLSEFVNALRGADADVVLTNFFTVDINGNNLREYKMSAINFNCEYSFQDFWMHKRNVREVCNFHGITYRTDFYQSLNLNLSEKISYEDQEYATIPFANVQTVLPLDLSVYRYRLGDQNQSMSNHHQVKNINQLEIVLNKIINSTPSSINPAAQSYFHYKKSGIILSYYMAALIKNPNKNNGRALAKKMHKNIRQQDHSLHVSTDKKYLLCVALSYISITDKLKINLQKSSLYQRLIRFFH